MKPNHELRAAILKYVEENPGVVASQIIKELGSLHTKGGDRSVWGKLLRSMYSQGSLSRKEAVVTGIDSRGNPYTNNSWAYSVGGQRDEKKAPAGIHRAPGYYSQRGGDWAVGSGGGQGALRRVFGIQSSAGML